MLIDSPDCGVAVKWKDAARPATLQPIAKVGERQYCTYSWRCENLIFLYFTVTVPAKSNFTILCLAIFQVFHLVGSTIGLYVLILMLETEMCGNLCDDNETKASNTLNTMITQLTLSFHEKPVGWHNSRVAVA